MKTVIEHRSNDFSFADAGRLVLINGQTSGADVAPPSALAEMHGPTARIACYHAALFPC